MTIFDWALSLSTVVANKILETLASEVLKNRIAGEKSNRARESLMHLYEQIGVLESDSNKFIDLLDTFLASLTKRTDIGLSLTDSNEPTDFPEVDHWFESWMGKLDSQAVEVASGMQKVITIIKELNPKAEIYLPDMVRTLARYENSTAHAERILIYEMSNNLPRSASPSWLVISYMEIATNIRKAVHELSEAKKELSSFIRAEFPFSD